MQPDGPAEMFFQLRLLSVLSGYQELLPFIEASLGAVAPDTPFVHIMFGT